MKSSFGRSRGIAAFGLGRPWDELAVELDGASAEENLRVLSAAGGALQPAPRPDLARVKLGDVQFTFSWREADPVAAAVSNALAQFNLLDVDANGYLERAEVAARFRFERGLIQEEWSVFDMYSILKQLGLLSG